MVTCPVCSMAVSELTSERKFANEGHATPHCDACWRPLNGGPESIVYEGQIYFFCSVGCKIAFELNPKQYLVRLEA